MPPAADHKSAALSTFQICLQEVKMKGDHVSCLWKIQAGIKHSQTAAGLVFHCRFMIPAFSDCSHYFSHFSALLYAYIDLAYIVKNFPCWLSVFGKSHHLVLILYSWISQPMGHGRIFDCSRPGIIEIEYVLQLNPLTQTLVAHGLQMTQYALFFHYALKDYCNTEVTT